jgi:hypothetical protein
MWKVAVRRREMGLGSFQDISLKEARALAADCRKTVKRGLDPIAARDATVVDGQPSVLHGLFLDIENVRVLAGAGLSVDQLGAFSYTRGQGFSPVPEGARTAAPIV